ncbi:MAG: glycosyltransferase family 4 protein [Thermoplasmata archaeon]
MRYLIISSDDLDDEATMRVCFLTRSVMAHQVGGMERQTHLLCHALCKLGHDVDIVTTAHPSGEREESGIENQRIMYLEGTEPGKYSVEWWSASKRTFMQLHSACPYDVVHGQSIGGYAVLGSAKRFRIPVVATCHGTPLSDTRTHMTTHRFRSKPVGVAGSLMYLPHHYSVYRSSNTVIAVSSQIRDHLVRFKFVKPDNVVVVPNGTDTQTFRPDLEGGAIREWLSVGNHKLILFIGRLIEEKGAQYAIQALPEVIRNVGDVRLVVAGSGPYASDLQDLARDLGISDRVVFAGFVPEEELPFLYASSDVLVFPTTHVEGFPLVLAEALASGLPIVSSDIGGTSAAVTHGETGFLFEPRDVQSLASHLTRVLCDKDLRGRMAKKARSVSLENFSAERMAALTVEVYERTLRRL